MSSGGNLRIPLGPINTKSLKKKDSPLVIQNNMQEEAARQESEALMAAGKKKKKPFRPPVPKFEDPQAQVDAEIKSDEVIKIELFSKFLEEINGGDPIIIEKVKAPIEIPIEEETPPAVKKQEEIKKPKPIQPPPDINFDLISNLYKKQVGGGKDAPVTSPSSMATLLNKVPALNLAPSPQPNLATKSLQPVTAGAAGSTPTGGSAAKSVPLAGPQKSLMKLKKEEYDPARPNDYETIIADRLRKKKEEENLMKERELEMEIEKLNSSKEKSSKSSADQNSRRQRVKEMELEKPEDPAPEQKFSEGAHEEKILKMMEKTGWKFGGGLGKNEQGMTTPLIPVKTNSTTAIIMNSNIEMQALLPQDIVLRKTLEAQNLKPTKVLLLLNMVSRSEVDDHLRVEVTEECSKHGKVLDCVILMLSNVSDDQSVRIFVDFDKKDSAIKAYYSLNGRFFAGRTVQARFYEEANFYDRKYDL